MNQRGIGIQLRSLNNQIRRFVDCATHKKYIDSLTGTNGWIIGYINDHKESGVFQRDFEREFGITRSTASKVVDLMVKKGFIERMPVLEDARLKRLVLTPKALELAEYMEEDHRRIDEVLTAGFSDEELKNFNSYIERMRNNIKI